MSWDHFAVEVDDQGVAQVTLSRPDTLNSLTFEVYADLVRWTDETARNPDVKAVVLAGQGRGFCSGGNIQEIMGPLLERDMEGVLAFTRMTCAVVANLRKMPQPATAAVAHRKRRRRHGT